MMKLNLIAAACGPELGIGHNGTLPWRLREEIKYFNRMTVGDGTRRNAVLMGRKTWVSIPGKMKPLKNRLNVILSRQEDYDPKADDVIVCKSIEDALEKIKQVPDVSDTVWVIGGTQIYESALKSEFFNRVYLTQISTHFDCDAFFPKINFSDYNQVTEPDVPQDEQKEGEITYNFKIFEKKRL